MKKKAITFFLALLTAAAFTACGEVEDEVRTDDTSSNEETVSQTDESSGEDSSMLSDVPPQGDSSSTGPLDIKIVTYSGEQVPQELKTTILKTLEGAAGEYSDFEKVFDPDILIEAHLRSAVSDPDQLAALRSQYDEETRRMTTKQNYDMLHSSLSGVKFSGAPEPIKIQTVEGDIESSMIFTLNFDIESSGGTLTFLGNAYRIDGKWGAVFEPGEHKSEDEILDKTEEDSE